MEHDQQETEAYLAKIRRTIAESNRLIEQTELRIAETDRMLASQGLTREQVLNFKFTPEQRAVVNREFAKNGLPPLEDDFASGSDGMIRAGDMQSPTDAPADPPADDDASSRSRKFGMMMKQFVI